MKSSPTVQTVCWYCRTNRAQARRCSVQSWRFIPDLFAEGVSIDLNNKDTVIQSTGVWIAEMGELDSTLKREQSALKAFLTAARDTYRMPYARAQIRKPRRTSFCATVNPKEFLNDETGSRRFWVIHPNGIDVERIRGLSADWLKQMWRQVYEQLYMPNPQGFRLTKEERAMRRPGTLSMKSRCRARSKSWTG